MRRAAALLTLPLYLTSTLILRCWMSIPWDYDPGFLLPLYLVLPPCLPVLAAGVGRDHPARRILQVVGGLGMLAVWAWLAYLAEDPFFDVVLAVPFLGMTAISLAEAVRRPPTPDPERRFTLALLFLFPVEVALSIAWELRTALDPEVRSMPGVRDWIEAVGTSVGLGCVFLLAAWGLVRDRRWTLWAALAASTVHAIAATVPYVTGKTSPAYYLRETFAGHLLLTTVAVLLIRRLRRPRQSVNA
ncbi:MAG TPA: hypothetical protein VF950_10385 [Planctomycetota bacterium]